MKTYFTPKVITVVTIENEVFCSSSSKRHRVSIAEPYHTLSYEQRYALMYLLSYFAQFANDYSVGFKVMNYDAQNYMKKAEDALGVSIDSISVDVNDKLTLNQNLSIIKTIKDKIILDYILSDSHNLIILSQEEDYEPSHRAFAEIWSEFGYSKEERSIIVRKYMYRTSI